LAFLTARLAFLTADCAMTVSFRFLDAYGGERFPGAEVGLHARFPSPLRAGLARYLG